MGDDEAEHRDAGHRVVLHQQRPYNIPRAGDERKEQQHRNTGGALRVQAAAHRKAQNSQRASPPTPRLSTLTEKLSACWVTALFHGPASAKMTDAISIKAMPFDAAAAVVAQRGETTPPKPSAQPSALRGVRRSLLP